MGGAAPFDALMTATAERSRRHHFAHAANFGRGFAGALIFGVPLMMTMEMWWLGFTLSARVTAGLLFPGDIRGRKVEIRPIGYRKP